jgi:hypothetical protein
VPGPAAAIVNVELRDVVPTGAPACRSEEFRQYGEKHSAPHDGPDAEPGCDQAPPGGVQGSLQPA